MRAGNSRQETGNSPHRAGLALVKKGPQRCAVEELGGLREGSTGRVVVMLPRVWAVAETVVAEPEGGMETRVPEAGHGVPGYGTPELVAGTQEGSRPKVEMAFYRRYTEALLRKYLRMSMAAGRVPSLLGRELFRGHVSSYRVNSFEDVVVFCMDVERCLAKLNLREKDLIRRVALQEYTQGEAAAVMGLSRRYVVQHYGWVLDKLTGMFLDAEMLESLKSCQ